MSENTSESTFTAEEMEATREAVRAVGTTEGMNLKEMADEAGIAYGTFHGWVKGKYEGNNDRVASKATIWLAAREERKQTTRHVQRAPDFQATPTGNKFIKILRFAQSMPDMAVVGGQPGIGKTKTIEYYAAYNPNVWVATMQPCTATVYPMLGELAEVMGIEERVQTKIARAIGTKLKQRPGGLIVVDEAQHLDARALDQLRSIFDLYRVGIALFGNVEIYGRLDGSGQKANFAQLCSRIGMRHTQSKAMAADMCTLIEAWGVTDKDEIRLLKAIADKPGALRNLTKVMQVASLLASGAGVERTIQHIKEAAMSLDFHASRTAA